MRTRALKRLLSEQGFSEVSSFEEFDFYVEDSPTSKVWYNDPLVDYWCVNTANGNYFRFCGDNSCYKIGQTTVGLVGEKTAISLFLCDLFGEVEDSGEWLPDSEVKDEDQFDKWFYAISGVWPFIHSNI